MFGPVKSAQGTRRTLFVAFSLPQPTPATVRNLRPAAGHLVQVQNLLGQIGRWQ